MAYSYYATITIDPSKVAGSSNLTDFPVLISGTYDGTDGEPDLRVVGSGGNIQNASGYDLAFFSDEALTTQLKHEVVTHNLTTGAIEMWVKVPTLDYDDNTVIYMAYGDSGISTSQADADNTWSSGYKAVYHMHSGTDSSGNGNTGTAQGGVSLGGSTGIVGAATDFDNSDDWVDCGAGSSLNITGDLVLSCWVNLDANTGQDTFINKEESATKRQYYLRNDAKYISFVGSSDGSSFFQQATNSTVLTSNSTWYYVTAKYISGGSASVTLLLNGAVQASSTITGTISSSLVSNETVKVQIGARRYPTPAEPMDGDIDEVRIYAGQQSTEWTLTEYNNQSSPATFYAVGDETEITPPPAGVVTTKIYTMSLAGAGY